MRRSRVFLLAAVLLAPALLSGCVAADWLQYRGDVKVQVGSADPSSQAIDRFQTLQVGVRAVMVKPKDEIQNLWHATHEPPVLLDLVQRAREGSAVTVFEDKFQVRQVERVTVILSVDDAVTVDGARLPICTKDSDGATAQRPCLAIAPGGSYFFDRKEDPVQMQRAKTTTIHFPLAVMCADMSKRGAPCGGDTVSSDIEYFIQSRGQEGRVSYS